MARVATKNTYGIEVVSDDIEVQRLIVAGQTIPDHYQVESDAFKEVGHSDVARTAAEEATSSRVLGRTRGDDIAETPTSGTPVDALASVGAEKRSSSGDGPTVEELQKRASELEIEGRSKMNKEDLERAIAEAGG